MVLIEVLNTVEQIWIISFKSIFLKWYTDISCILLPADSPHPGVWFFLVFCWVWRSKSEVNLHSECFSPHRITLSFIDNSVQTIYTYICHPLSPECGRYQLQTWSWSDPRVHRDNYTPYNVMCRMLSCRSQHGGQWMQRLRFHLYKFVSGWWWWRWGWEERDVFNMTATTLSVNTWIFVYKREFHMIFLYTYVTT